MSKIFIFGFDSCYPEGGLNDLKAVLDTADGELTNSDGLIKDEALERTLRQLDILPDHLQVVHLDEQGMPLVTENWRCEDPGSLIAKQNFPRRFNFSRHGFPYVIIRMGMTTHVYLTKLE